MQVLGTSDYQLLDPGPKCWDSGDFPRNSWRDIQPQVSKVDLQGSWVRASNAGLKECTSPWLDSEKLELGQKIKVGPQGWL